MQWSVPGSSLDVLVDDMKIEVEKIRRVGSDADKLRADGADLILRRISDFRDKKRIEFKEESLPALPNGRWRDERAAEMLKFSDALEAVRKQRDAAISMGDERTGAQREWWRARANTCKFMLDELIPCSMKEGTSREQLFTQYILWSAKDPTRIPIEGRSGLFAVMGSAFGQAWGSTKTVKGRRGWKGVTLKGAIK